VHLRPFPGPANGGGGECIFDSNKWNVFAISRSVGVGVARTGRAGHETTHYGGTPAAVGRPTGPPNCSLALVQ
jgi:hypothetical protein